MWQKTILRGALIPALCCAALAQTAQTKTSAAASRELSERQAYCEYVAQQAMAQRDLLLTPSATAGFTQPNTGLPMQLVWGISSSLSDVRKAGLTMDAARKNCELYGATTAVQQNIQYALPVLEKQALEHRLEMIQRASDKLDTLIAGTREMVDAQNLTRPMLFSLQTTRIKLSADRADTQAKISALYTPNLAAKPLKQLVAEKQSGEVNQQNAIEKLSRQNNWDVSLSIGAHQQINPLSDAPAPYGAVTVSYNLGSQAIDKHLAQAADAYANWKNVQEGDVVRNAEVLRQQIVASISAQANRLKSLKDEQQQFQSNLLLVAGTDTTAAIDFRNQLTTAQLLMEVEVGDASFRLGLLQDFLENNY
jgi:hypothetical protein